jgi:hypothetical protein
VSGPVDQSWILLGLFERSDHCLSHAREQAFRPS